jgi:hypothetical protein
MKNLAVPALLLAFSACSVHETPASDPAVVAILDDTSPDAGIAIDAVDAAPSDSGVFAYQCDYIEQQDSSNDYQQTAGYQEDTGWGIGPEGGSRFTLCGNINAGHYNAAAGSIDVDRFTFEVFPAATVTIKFSGHADYISSQILGTGNGKVGVFLRDNATGATLYEGAFFSGNAATFTAAAPSGQFGSTYDLDVEAYDTEEDITSSITYAIEITGS